jgi:hypothetical protein
LLLLLLQPLHVTEHLVSMCDEIVVLFASDVLVLVLVVVVALIFLKFDELLIGLVNLLRCGPYLVQGFVNRGRQLWVGPSSYRGSACTSTFLMRTNALRCPFAEVLRRASSFAVASSAAMAEVGGMLVSNAVILEL